MDTEEKKTALPPQGKGKKRRKKKPAAAQGDTASRERTAQETVPQLVKEPAAPEQDTPQEEPEAPAPEPAETENAAPPVQEDPVSRQEAEPGQAEEKESPERSESSAAPESAEPSGDAADKTPPQAAPEHTAPLPEEREDPLPDGVAVSEVDLSDALDKMMQDTPEKAVLQSGVPEEPLAEPEEIPAEQEEAEPSDREETEEAAGQDHDPEKEEPSAEVQPETDAGDDEESAEPPEAAEEDEDGGPASGEEEMSSAETAEETGHTDAEAPGQEQTGEETAETDGEKRLSDLTRTVQLSVEQITAHMEAETAEEAEEAEEQPATLQDHLRNGVSGMCKWLLLVVFFVLVIAGGGVAWLYRSATPDMVPVITVSFGGQTVQPAAYKWKVPVVGNLFKRTYAETLSSVPVVLESPVEQSSPDVEISPSDYRAELTVTDSADNVIYEGDVESFAAYQFAANGQYTAKLVVYVDQSTVSGAADVSGSETWLFTFDLGVRASIHLNSETVDQGGVAAIRVGTTLDGQPPKIETELENTGFYPAGVGWVCYLPIPWNQKAQDYAITVTAGGHTEPLTLKVRAADWEYKDYSSESQRAQPYIGDADMPAAVKTLLADGDDEIAWTNSNFVQPFLRTLDVELAYGTTEYVGRSYSERSANTGAGGRTAINTILNTARGELLIAPANGTVLLAKDLGGVYGNTLVIDHGAGVKSIFYGLDELEAKVGETLKQGQTLATCGRTTVAELRIGDVPVDPLPVWRGQCDALKYY